MCSAESNVITNGLCDAVMARRLGAVQRQRFDALPDIVYALHPDLTIGYVNTAWLTNVSDPAFHANWGLGTDVRTAWPEHLRNLLINMVQPLAEGTGGGPPLRLDYACPTPEQHRRFTMWLHPLDHAVLVVNAQVLAQPAISSVQNPGTAAYTRPDGRLHQCLNCRRTLTADGSQWDWIPEWVSQMPPETTSDLCGSCERTFLARLNRLVADNS